MGGIYTRGNKLWFWYVDASGERQWQPSGLSIGEEAKARKALAVIERRIEAEVLTGIPSGELTVKAYGEKWLKARPQQGVATAADEARRLRLHAWPLIGHHLLKEARTKHIRDMVQALEHKKVRRNKRAKEEIFLAPRTIRNVYGTLHILFHHAVVDELLATNPCVLKKGELPAKVDKDRTWRHSAIFTRQEAEQLISDPRIPEDRRVVNALELVAGLRGGEDAALRWHHYDADAEPLGMLLVALNWDSRQKVLTTTKTEVVRKVPVHPTLAKLLASWKVGGWARMFGRQPGPDDLIVPNRDGQPRHGQRTIRRFHEDLERLGLRKRRKHDCRRTFITLARRDGARADILKWVTHGPPKEMMDEYTSWPFEDLCAEVAKLRVELRAGQIVELRQVIGAACDSPCDSPTAEMKKPPRFGVLEAKIDEREKGFERSLYGESDAVQVGGSEEFTWVGSAPASADDPEDRAAVTNVTEALRDALVAWEFSADRSALAASLTALLREVEGA